MSSEMIERVARALFSQEVESGFRWEDQTDDFKRYWLASARAAIEAMRVPTEQMYAAGVASGDWGPGATTLEDNARGIHDASPDTCWQAMTDAALTGGK